jgi:hypothetical protein
MKVRDLVERTNALVIKSIWIDVMNDEIPIYKLKDKYKDFEVKKFWCEPMSCLCIEVRDYE